MTKLPNIGERVYVVPYTVPGHEMPGYSGTVSRIDEPNDSGHRLVCLVDCTGGRGTIRGEWLHFISGYTQEIENGPE